MHRKERGEEIVKKLFLVILLLLPSTIVRGQSIPNAGPNDSFGWGQSAPTLNDANAYVYKYYLDGATTGSVFTAVKCTGTTSPFSCQVRIPTFAPGQHSVTFTAANSTGESVQSTPFAFVYGNPPTSPNNISIIRATP